MEGGRRAEAEREEVEEETTNNTNGGKDEERENTSPEQVSFILARSEINNYIRFVTALDLIKCLKQIK